MRRSKWRPGTKRCQGSCRRRHGEATRAPYQLPASHRPCMRTSWAFSTTQTTCAPRLHLHLPATPQGAHMASSPLAHLLLALDALDVAPLCGQPARYACTIWYVTSRQEARQRRPAGTGTREGAARRWPTSSGQAACRFRAVPIVRWCCSAMCPTATEVGVCRCRMFLAGAQSVAGLPPLSPNTCHAAPPSNARLPYRTPWRTYILPPIPVSLPPPPPPRGPPLVSPCAPVVQHPLLAVPVPPRHELQREDAPRQLLAVQRRRGLLRQQQHLLHHPPRPAVGVQRLELRPHVGTRAFGGRGGAQSERQHVGTACSSTRRSNSLGTTLTLLEWDHCPVHALACQPASPSP